MRKIETSYLTQIWTSGPCPQRGHIDWADKQEFSAHLDLQSFKVAKTFVFTPAVNIVANGTNHRKL
jgi:hypothetical protein